MSKKSEILTCQRLLALMVFLGFLIHHMLRINISIAIVEMVAKNNHSETHGPRFNWNEEEKNDILGIFFWGYVITQIPGGYLSEKYGAKIVVGIGILTASILTLLTPKASQMGYYWLLFTRFCLGVAMGIHWPSTAPLSVNWIPPTDTSKFMSHMQASSLGVALILPISGYLIAHFGWPSVFYVTGTVTLVWTLCWFYLVYDTPDKHPRISKNEEENLRKQIKNVHSAHKTATPWKKVLTSGPVWAVIIANAGSCFTFFIAFNQLPTYLSQVLQFDIRQIGWISSVPYLTRYFVALVSATVADEIIKGKKCSTTAVRKFFTCLLFLVGTCVFAVQAIWGYNRIVTIVVFTIFVGSMGLGCSGFYASIVDIAPSHSGTIFGYCQIPAVLIGYVTTKIVGLVTKKQQTFGQWTYIFWSMVAINLFCLVFSLVYISGDRQSWDSRKDQNDKSLEVGNKLLSE